MFTANRSWIMNTYAQITEFCPKLDVTLRFYQIIRDLDLLVQRQISGLSLWQKRHARSK